MTPNRWRIPIGAVLVHICIGSVYAWSTFNRPIQAVFPGSAWWFSPPYTTFTTALALLGLSAAFGGPWVERRGPRVAATAAALFFGTGLLVGGVGLAVRSPVTKGTVRLLVALVAFPLAWGIAATQLADGWAVAWLIIVYIASVFAAVIVLERAIGLVYKALAWRAARERVSFLGPLRAHREDVVRTVVATLQPATGRSLSPGP